MKYFVAVALGLICGYLICLFTEVLALLEGVTG